MIFIVGVLVVGPQRMVQYSQRISKWVKNARKFIQQYSIVLKDIQDLNIEEDTERKDEKSKEKNEEQNSK